MDKSRAYSLGKAFRAGLAFSIGKSGLAMDAKNPAFELLHPRDILGQFVESGTQGVTAKYETKQAYQKRLEREKNGEKGEIAYSSSPIKSIPKTREHIDRSGVEKFKNVPKHEAKTISQIPESELLIRGNKRGGKKGDGSTYEWSKNGVALSQDECMKIESALKNWGDGGDALSSLVTDVKVRPDLYHGRGQIYTAKTTDGDIKSGYDPYSLMFNNSQKYARVVSLSKAYGNVLGEIKKDLSDKSAQAPAMLAYFMHRTRTRIGSGKTKTGSIGASQLTADNIKIDGDNTTIEFDAKNGHWRLEVKDGLLAEYLRKRKEHAKAGERIFGTTYDRERKYLSSLSERVGVAMDAHDFRRVGATKIVDNVLKSKEKQIREHLQSGNETEYNKILVEAVNQAAEYLNDKAVTALKAYIAPQVLYQFTPERIEKHLRWVSGIADDEDAKHDI